MSKWLGLFNRNDLNLNPGEKKKKKASKYLKVFEVACS